MPFEAIELVCGCCEFCLSLGDAASSKKEAKEAPRSQPSRLVRMVREEKRGVRLTFAKNRIGEIE